MKALPVYSFIIPVNHAGSAHGYLVGAFGGATLYPACLQGGWLDNDREPVFEPVVRIDVATARDAHALQSHASHLGELLGESAIYFEDTGRKAYVVASQAP